MDFELIRVFLAVVDTGSISSAAELLYASQSTVSRKINALELEVGTPLINRAKGVRHIELTAQGEEFLQKARQIQSISMDISAMKHNEGRSFLSIAMTSSGNYLFTDFHIGFIQRHPEICLSFHMYHSSEIAKKLSDHDIDIGYISFRHNMNHIEYAKILEMPRVLTTHKNSPYDANMTISQLPAGKELYIRLDSEYELWHDHLFPGKQYLMRVSDEIQLPSFLSLPDTWAFCALPIAQLMPSDDIKYFPISGVPRHVVYQCIHDFPRSSRKKAMEIYKKELAEYIQKTFGDWP